MSDFYPVDDCGAIGIVRDAAPHELPPNAWSEGKNVRFADGYVERMRGHVAIYDPPSIVPYFLHPYSTGAGRQWIYAGAAKMYSVSTTVHTNITRQSGGSDQDYSATADNVWTAATLGGIAFLNNGVDVPQQYSGSGAASNLSNWTSTVRCKSLRSYKYSLVAMNTTESGSSRPHRVLVSHPADPGSVPASWDETDATKDVFKNDLSATPDRLVDGMSMGESFYLYKESSIYRMNAVGGNALYSTSDPLSREAGALALNCIADCPLGHVVLGQGDVFLNSGAKIESVASERVRRWLQTSLDATYYGRSYVTANPTKKEIWVCIPTVGNSVPNMAAIWNYQRNTWTFRELPNAHFAACGVIDATVSDSIDSRTEAIDSYTDPYDLNEYTQSAQRLVMASSATKLHLADSTRLFNGTNYTAYVARTGLHLAMPNYYKLLHAIWPQFEGPNGEMVRIYAGGCNRPGEAITWSAATDFTIGTDEKADFGMDEWRYLAVKVESVTQATWRLKSYLIEYTKTGMH